MVTTESLASVLESTFLEIHLPMVGAAQKAGLLFAQYPTTVTEYRKFIDAGGYGERRWWTQRGWTWRTKNNIVQPAYWREPGYEQPSKPVTGVSFWEAEAYARFRGASLPTEHEWYFLASNGGTTRYPWGNQEPDPDRANLAFFGAFGVSQRLPVNRPTTGASPDGVADLIGNVSEWCLPGADTELASEAMQAVLRGGACWHVPGTVDASFRDVVPLAVRDNQTGIRLVLRAEAQGPDLAILEATRPEISRLGKTIARPTAPFRQEGMPVGMTEQSWHLGLSGAQVDRPRFFSLSDLRRDFPVATDNGMFVCVCRWGERNQFRGLLLRDLLGACGVPCTAPGLYLLQRSFAGPAGRVYETTVPIREAVEHGALLAFEMDGHNLTPELGWPLRYVDFGLYGYKCVKCLSELIVTTEFQPGWWEQECQYDIHGTILPGTITLVGKDACRFDIRGHGRVREQPQTGHAEPL